MLHRFQWHGALALQSETTPDKTRELAKWGHLHISVGKISVGLVQVQEMINHLEPLPFIFWFRPT